MRDRYFLNRSQFVYFLCRILCLSLSALWTIGIFSHRKIHAVIIFLTHLEHEKVINFYYIILILVMH